MGSLIIKVKAKLKIYSHEKTRGLLEGEYGSVFKGRSMDFEDLREYTLGDDIKDIDWKATARSGTTLIRRYVAIRKHNILIVNDTGLNMLAHSKDGDLKKDVGVMIAGIIGYVAQKHGDLVAMVAGDERRTIYLPLKGTNAQLEFMLQQILDNTTESSAESNLTKQLEFIARNISRRMIVTIISDDRNISATDQHLLRRLVAQHEMMLVNISDLDPTDKRWKDYDIESVNSGMRIPNFIKNSPKLNQELGDLVRNDGAKRRRRLQRSGIMSESINGENDVIYKLFKLLRKQRYAK